jgi:leucyl aminopeptidase
MKFEISQNPLHKISSDVVLLFAFQNENEKKADFISTLQFSQVDKALDGQLKSASVADKFTGGAGESVVFFTSNKIVPTKIAVLGLGKQSEFVLNDLRKVIGKYISSVKKKVDSIVVSLPDNLDDLVFEDIASVVVEGALLGAYDFAKYKSKKRNERNLDTVVLSIPERADLKSIKKAVAHAELYAQGTLLARDLVNEQAAIATPTFLANLARDIAKSSPAISCKVFDKAQAEKMGMDAFLGIARASDTPPKFIVLEYNPAKSKSKKKLAIVGKGITFDSGGINVKPGDHMQDMKMDMSGAALVLGVFSVISQIKPSFPVMGIIAATPNLISSSSIVPGDVVRAMNGKTIEVLNTDAEGRVTMADSLSYAVKEGATEIIDFATLTGACLVALGDEIAGMFSNNRDLVEEIKTAAFEEGEKVWELPLEKDYKDMNKSEVADIANIPNSRYGGTITAALFLQEFIANTPWIHFDIAGPAFANKPQALTPKGGTGFGVRTMLKYIEGVNK